MKSYVLSITIVTTALTALALAEEVTKLSVPVRVLSTKSPKTPAAAMTSPVEGRGPLPQYQGNRPNPAHNVDFNNAAIRFIVPLRQRPILVEARIFIDGKPFRMIREQRVDRLLAELDKPVVAKPPAENVEKKTDVSADSSEKNNSTTESPKEKNTDKTEDPADETSPQDAVEDEDESKTEDDKADAKAEEKGAAAEKPQALDNSISARLRRYAAVTKRKPTRDEVRWLLSIWANGPTLLVLSENFQRVRAGQMPLLRLLDRDEDGVLSDVELIQAEQTLLRYDKNQNDLLTYNEIADAAESFVYKGPVENPSPLIPLGDLASAQVFARLAKLYETGEKEKSSFALHRFDTDQNGKLDESELAQLHDSDPDLRVEVTFSTTDSAQSKVTITEIHPEFRDVKTIVRTSSITLQVAGSLLELSAVQPGTGIYSDQISIGALKDGYPLLPVIDPNNDGRLTLRELWDVTKHLKALDRNQDGNISSGEILPTVRVSIGHGPSVHLHLADLRSVHPPQKPHGVKTPKWFGQMDKNKDEDLTRREFLGTDEQFAALDFDKDGLIHVVEAVRSEDKKTRTPDESPDNKTPESANNKATPERDKKKL